MQAPAGDVEETPPLFGHPILALDSLAPPFAEVASGSELQQFLAVLHGPTSEARVVLFGRDPAGPRSGQHLTIFGDEDLRVGPVDFLSDDALSGEACHLRELNERR